MAWFNNWIQSIKSVSGPSRYGNDKRHFFEFGNREVIVDLETEDDYRGAYLSCPAVKAILNARAQQFANGEIEILSSTTQNAKRGAKAKLLRERLKKPNVLQSWKQFFAQFHTYIDLFGYCPVLKIEPVGFEGTGTISSLWCLPPWLFEVEFTGKWTGQTTSAGIYKAFYMRWNGQSRKELPMESVGLILDNAISTRDDNRMLLPDSRLKGCHYLVSNINAAYKSRHTLITKKGAIGILSNVAKDVSGPVPMKQGEKQAVQDDFSRYGLTGQEWQVIVTDADLKWQSMTVPTKDLMLFEEVEDDILRLCDNLGLKADLIGSVKKSTFNNQDAAKKAQYEDNIIPDAEARLEQLSEFIIPAEERAVLRITYGHLKIFQENAKEKADALVSMNLGYEVLFRNGLVNKNMWAEAAGIDTIPDGDKYIYDMNDNTPLAVKLGVGGTQALKEMLTAVMSPEQKSSVLQIVFGISPADANKLAGVGIVVEKEVDPNAAPENNFGQAGGNE